MEMTRLYNFGDPNFECGVPECLLYWLALETTLPQIEHIFALLADHVPERFQLEIWAYARKKAFDAQDTV